MSPLPLLLVSLSIARPAEAASARPITPPYQGNCQGPVWSPTGARLAFEVNFHDRKVVELYVYTPGSGDPRKVSPMSRGSSSLTAGFGTAAESVAHEPSWGPPYIDRFVYSATNASRDQDLYVDRASVLAPAAGADGGADWSPDGRWIIFTSARSGQGDLYLIDAHQMDQAPRRLTQQGDSSELYAAWSPDGSKLVYVAHTEIGDNLWILDPAQTGKPRALTTGNGMQTRPSWSPDGSRVAFYSNQDDPKRWDLYVVAGAGGSPNRMAQGVVLNPRGPTWTPDSSRLVYVKDDDAAYDPVWTVPIANPAGASALATGTVGNSDLDVARGTDGAVWLAVAAQGLLQDEVRDFKRIFVMTLD